MKKIVFLFILPLFLPFQSCVSYYMTVDSLKQQFSGIDSAQFKMVSVVGPLGELYHYKANPIKNITCKDKKGKEVHLKNSPRIEIRFTHGMNNKRTVFYFDRIYVKDCCVYGTKSRFIPWLTGRVVLNEISKIEIQDGKKKFYYMKKI